jgi:hypothetical protein
MSPKAVKKMVTCLSDGSEERYCRFCELPLPDWKDAFLELPLGQPFLKVNLDGQFYFIPS